MSRGDAEVGSKQCNNVQYTTAPFSESDFSIGKRNSASSFDMK